ncbi:hypothetical protein ACP70R_040810 [Stipagrostis hirtigluma subsp. patula]
MAGYSRRPQRPWRPRTPLARWEKQGSAYSHARTGKRVHHLETLVGGDD